MNGVGAEEVVVEAVLDHRADRHLRAGPQRLHRLGEHVRRVVADQLERARVVADELELGQGRNDVDEIDLERLALPLEEALGGVAAHRRLHERPVARDDLTHALFDRRKILGGERRRAEEVVIEAVLDYRADRHLRVGPQRLHRLGEHVRRVVADELERARIVAIDELDLRVGVDLFGEVRQRAVANHRDAALGQRRRDRLGDGEAGKAGFERAARAVGESNADHNRSCGSLAETGRRKRMGCV